MGCISLQGDPQVQVLWPFSLQFNQSITPLGVEGEAPSTCQFSFGVSLNTFERGPDFETPRYTCVLFAGLPTVATFSPLGKLLEF